MSYKESSTDAASGESSPGYELSEDEASDAAREEPSPVSDIVEEELPQVLPFLLQERIGVQAGHVMKFPSTYNHTGNQILSFT